MRSRPPRSAPRYWSQLGLGGFYAANGVFFALLNATDAVCSRPKADLAELTPGMKPESRRFDISDPCFATRVRLAAGVKYRIIFTDPTTWRDGRIDLAGF